MEYLDDQREAPAALVSTTKRCKGAAEENASAAFHFAPEATDRAWVSCLRRRNGGEEGGRTGDGEGGGGRRGGVWGGAGEGEREGRRMTRRSRSRGRGGERGGERPA
eukprot:978994-Rhodomonas_salina.2